MHCFRDTGLWRNWLAHWTVDPGVAGSSPVDPAISKSIRTASWCNGSTADSDSACWGSSPCEATITNPLSEATNHSTKKVASLHEEGSI